MNEQEFEEWLMKLPLQTLTDELKETIQAKVSDMVYNVKYNKV